MGQGSITIYERPSAIYAGRKSLDWRHRWHRPQYGMDEGSWRAHSSDGAVAMPIFEAQSDSGQSFQIDAPDALAASTIFKNYMASQPAPNVSAAGDVAKSAGIGAAEGTI